MTGMGRKQTNTTARDKMANSTDAMTNAMLPDGFSCSPFSTVGLRPYRA